MATTWADVIASAMVLIDDVRLEEQMAVSPAQFYRRMAGWVDLAFPKLNRPPELYAYIKKGKINPDYTDFEWESTEESTIAATEVETGAIGYELCSVTMRILHPNNTVSLLPYSAAIYDAETGVVTFPKQEKTGICYEIDFYKDGEFSDLSEAQMRLMALAISTLWDNRFQRDWLGISPKIHDDSFNPPNEAQYMEKSTKRWKENVIAFNDELRDYEQSCTYAAALKNVANRVTLV